MATGFQPSQASVRRVSPAVSPSIAEQRSWFGEKTVRGYLAYHAAPTNSQAFGADCVSSPR